jgi:hypothetical protein
MSKESEFKVDKRAYEDIPLSPMEKNVLLHLLKYGKAKPSEIARKLALEAASVRRALQQLRSKKLLTNEDGIWALSEFCKTLVIQKADPNRERLPTEIQNLDPSSDLSLVFFSTAVEATEPQHDKLSDLMLKRLLYDPSKACYKGHTAVRPYPPYRTRWGPVRRFYCSVCRQTYSELVKPQQAFEMAVLIAHYFGRTSTRRLSPVFQYIAKALSKAGTPGLPDLASNELSNGLSGHKKKKLRPLFHESTSKRIIKKYAIIATYATPDSLTVFFHSRVSGYFGLDGFNVPTKFGRRICLIAYDLVNRDVVSLLFSSNEQPTENLYNCKRFIRQFKETMERTGVKIKQMLVDDRKEFWQACLEELPSDIVLTQDCRHFLENVEKSIPKGARTAKAEGLIAEVAFALQSSTSKERSIEILQHVTDSGDHWLNGESHRASKGVRQILRSLDELTISRLLSHFELVKPGTRKRFRSTNPTEGGGVGVFRAALRNLNCLQSEEAAPGQMNLLALIARLMPSTKDGRSSFQRGRVKKTLDDLMAILLMFDPDSPIQ